MRRMFSLPLGLLLILPLASAQIYVSPRGSDQSHGTAAHPVLTLQRALALSRASGEHRIVLNGGTYRLTAPLRLTAADAGLTFSAAPGERPILSGGIRITDWRQVNARENLWAAPVPRSVKNSRQLYINGLRAARTRGLICSGQSTATLKATPIDDALIEGPESVTLAVVAGSGYTVGSPANATGSPDSTPNGRMSWISKSIISPTRTL